MHHHAVFLLIFVISSYADGVFGERCKYSYDCRNSDMYSIVINEMTCGSNKTCVCTGDVGPVYSQYSLEISCDYDYLSEYSSKYYVLLKLILMKLYVRLCTNGFIQFSWSKFNFFTSFF